MHVSFVLPHAGMAGGIRVIAIPAGRLRARGHAVTVVSLPPRRITAGGALRALTREGRWPRSEPSSPYFEGLDIDLPVLESRRPVVDADLPDADAVVATWWETAFAVAALAPSKGAKFYFVQHHEAHPGQPAHLVHGGYMLPLQKIVVSSWLAEVMASCYGDRQVTLVANAVDHALFHAPPRGRQGRPTVGLMYSTKTFKGIDVSLRAIERARAQIADLAVIAFGVEPASRPPLPPGATYLRDPPQERLREIYAASDVWLMGSHSEGFELPILEAMACRCPVVSKRVGAAIDVIDEGVNGYVAPPGDWSRLGDRLAAVLALADTDWRRVSEAAFAGVAAYGWDDAARAFEAVLLGAAQGAVTRART